MGCYKPCWGRIASMAQRTPRQCYRRTRTSSAAVHRQQNNTKFRTMRKHIKCHVKASASEKSRHAGTTARKSSWSWLTTPSDGRWAAANGRRRTAGKRTAAAGTLECSQHQCDAGVSRQHFPAPTAPVHAPRTWLTENFAARLPRESCAWPTCGACAATGPWPAPAGRARSRHPNHACSSRFATPTTAASHVGPGPRFPLPRADRTPTMSPPESGYARTPCTSVSDIET